MFVVAVVQAEKYEGRRNDEWGRPDERDERRDWRGSRQSRDFSLLEIRALHVRPQELLVPGSCGCTSPRIICAAAAKLYLYGVHSTSCTGS